MVRLIIVIVNVKKRSSILGGMAEGVNACLPLIYPCSRRSIGLYFLSRLGHAVPANEKFRKRRHDTQPSGRRDLRKLRHSLPVRRLCSGDDIPKLGPRIRQYPHATAVTAFHAGGAPRVYAIVSYGHGSF